MPRKEKHHGRTRARFLLILTMVSCFPFITHLFASAQEGGIEALAKGTYTASLKGNDLNISFQDGAAALAGRASTINPTLLAREMRTLLPGMPSTKDKPEARDSI